MDTNTEDAPAVTVAQGVRRSEQIGKLALALAKAQGDIEGAAKDSKNPHFNSRYADLASIWDACRKALAANEIAVIQSPRADGQLVTVETLLAHSSGEWMTDGGLTMLARDAGAQAIGSCITYGRRYGLASMVGVAPDDDDGEGAEGRPATPVQPTPNRPPFVPVRPTPVPVARAPQSAPTRAPQPSAKPIPTRNAPPVDDVPPLSDRDIPF